MFNNRWMWDADVDLPFVVRPLPVAPDPGPSRWRVIAEQVGAVLLMFALWGTIFALAVEL